MTEDYILLNAPTFFSNEKKYLQNCIDTSWVSTAGSYVNEFEKKISDYTKSKYAIACNSGTAALQISLKIAGVKENDEVIVPTITFIAPVNAIKYNNAFPVFMDVDDFFNIDVFKLKEFLEKETYYKNGFTYNKKTNRVIKAILPVHVWGNAANLEPIIEYLEKINIDIIEDASESLGSEYQSGKLISKHTGTVGKLGCLSFNGNKIITTGGGGIILTNEKLLAEKAFYFSNQAKDDQIKFIHNDIGYNYRLTNLQAAVGLAQSENIEKILAKKRKIHKTYTNYFENCEFASILKSPAYSENNNWMNVLIIENDIMLDIDKIVAYFKKNNIEIRPVWYPNHLQAPYTSCQNFKIENAMKLVNKSICLPSSYSLSNAQIEKIYKIFINYMETSS